MTLRLSVYGGPTKDKQHVKLRSKCLRIEALTGDLLADLLRWVQPILNAAVIGVLQTEVVRLGKIEPEERLL